MAGEEILSPLSDPPDPSAMKFGELLRQMLADVVLLGRQEIRLGQKALVSRLQGAAAALGLAMGGMVGAIVGVGMLSIALASFLTRWISIASAQLLVGAFWLVLSFLLIRAAQRVFKREALHGDERFYDEQPQSLAAAKGDR